MAYIFVGLGNPGEEYEHTRHNAGRLALMHFQKQQEFSDWKFDRNIKALVSSGTLCSKKTMLLLPETFMNNSGQSVRAVLKDPKDVQKLAVVYDDLDLPFGSIRISYNRGDGGHRGLSSIIKSIKSREFVRIRIGVAPTTAGGKLRKPDSSKTVNFIVGAFKKPELNELKKVNKKVSLILQSLVEHGKEKTMTEFN